MILVPLGLNPEGHEVHAEDAEKEIEYRCPSCLGELILRKGPQRRVHFAHKAIPQNCDFTYETESHLRAKWAIVKAIEQDKAGLFLRKCKRCGTYTTQSIPESVTKAELEYLLPSGHRADVALLDQTGKLLAILEIFATHRVDEEKAKALAGTPWAEIEAETVLTSNEWLVLRDNFKPVVCSECVQIMKYGTTRPFTGYCYRHISCPVKGGRKISAVDNCSRCSYLVNVKANGVVCYGRKQT